MRAMIISVLLLTAASCCMAASEDPAVSLFPRPKVVKFSQKAVVLKPDSAAIVIDTKATVPEKYAAEALQKNIAKRFGRKWPVISESSNLREYKTLIILGQHATCKMLGAQNKSKDNSSGFDGYSISCGAENGRIVVKLAGSSARAVIYAQDTLFQLIKKQGDKILFHPAEIKDWASIQWRGRVRTDISQYDAPDDFDIMAQGRVNFIDLRDAPDTFGTPPGRQLRSDKIKHVIKEAHKRGMLAYAEVNCAVTRDKYDAVIKTYEDFIKLGADGLWMSFAGAHDSYENAMTPEIVGRVVELGRKHGMTGSLIAIQPSKESYISILTDKNRQIAKVDGMADALWFFAVKPSAQSLKDAESIGIKAKPCWWNHWPRPRIGFDFRDNFSTRLDGKPAYTNIPPLSEGYQTPAWDELANAADQIGGVIPWGGSMWGQEYVNYVQGLWAWAPELHDWKEHRARIYDIVFGPSAVKLAMEFDDALEIAESLIRTAEPPGAEVFTWPAVLKSGSDKKAVLNAAGRLEKMLPEIGQTAKTETLLDSGRLEQFYLEPMRSSISSARVIAGLNYSEYWWEKHNQRILMAVRAGNFEQARAWQDEVMPRIIEDARKVEEQITQSLKFSDGYLQSWAKYFPRAGFAKPTDKNINFAGDLSDPLWAETPALSDFNLNGSGTPENKTEVKLICTDQAAYIGFVCCESNMGNLFCSNKDRDSAVWDNDSVEVFINTDGMLFPHYHFIVGADGILYDGVQNSEDDYVSSWNGVWEAKTVKHSDRWTAEIRIPLSTLGAAGSQQGKLWMCNFGRNDFAHDDPADHHAITSMWGCEPAGSLHDTAKFRPVWFK